MTQPLFDSMGAPLTVSNTTYDTETGTQTNTYSFTAPPNAYALIGQTSVYCDSNFSTNGRLQGTIKGFFWTVQGATASEIQVINGFTIDWDKTVVGALVIPPGQTLRIRFRVTTASGSVQVQNTGLILTPEEFSLWVKNNGGLQ